MVHVFCIPRDVRTGQQIASSFSGPGFQLVDGGLTLRDRWMDGVEKREEARSQVALIQ
jgi:hypothetical protein